MAAHTRFLELRMRGLIHGQETVNVFHFGNDQQLNAGDPLGPILTQLAIAMIACAVDSLIPAVTSDWTLTSVDVKQLSPALSDPVEQAVTANNVGTRAPVNTSFESSLMRLRTGGGGKRGRGRRFLPPAGDADMTNSVLSDGTVLGQLQEFLDCLTGKFIGAGATEPFILGVLSRKHLQENPGDFANAFRECTILSIEPRVSCLRSRKVGHGS